MRGKAELAKQKKKLESDVNEVEAALEAANRAVAEAGKGNGKLRQLLGEQQGQAEDQERQKAELREAVVAAERKLTNLMVEVDEFRSALHNVKRTETKNRKFFGFMSWAHSDTKIRQLCL